MTKILTLTVISLSLLLSQAAYASKTYTPAQLRKMINAGKPPEQGTPTAKSQPASFSACVTQVNTLIDSVKDQYPTAIIVQTKILHMAKLWTNDGAMTFSCSEPDGKLITTTAKYL